MPNVHERLKSIQTDLLDDIKKENDELRTRASELQAAIERGESEIRSVSTAFIRTIEIGKTHCCL